MRAIRWWVFVLKAEIDQQSEYLLVSDKIWFFLTVYNSHFKNTSLTLILIINCYNVYFHGLRNTPLNENLNGMQKFKDDVFILIQNLRKIRFGNMFNFKLCNINHYQNKTNKNHLSFPHFYSNGSLLSQKFVFYHKHEMIKLYIY